ncbi:MAG: hypothetical protein DI573_12235 [Microbacterium sp.]|jgi:hypothetical protein|nr:MAG: hypothetical protein DI573_12235 [Microbacterium sp.]
MPYCVMRATANSDGSCAVTAIDAGLARPGRTTLTATITSTAITRSTGIQPKRSAITRSALSIESAY